jgi:arylsulfatase A-like enzyme
MPPKTKTPATANVLWITCDEMKASALSVYGNRQLSMPATERLAREGVVVRQAFTQIGKCIPVRSTFLTGRYPHVDGMRTMSRRDFSAGNFMLLSQDDPSLLTWLRDEGYRLAITGKNHVTQPEATREFFEEIPQLRKPVAPTYHSPGELCERA